MKWAQEQRMNFIRERLDQTGTLNRKDLAAQFRISIPQASLDIQKFIELNPQAMQYNRSLKRYEACNAGV